MRVHLNWNNHKKITFLVNICKIVHSRLTKYFISDKNRRAKPLVKRKQTEHVFCY